MDYKHSIPVIRSQDDLGRHIHIEMPTSLATGLRRRLAYDAARLWVDQLREEMDYRELCPAISICVLSESMFPKVPDLHLDFRLRERSSLALSDNLQVHLLELPKSRAAPHNVDEVSPIERWAFLLLNADRIDADVLRRLLPELELHNALGVLEMTARSPETRELYEARLKVKRDEKARLDYARSEGRAEGLAEGEQIGLARGEKIGQIRLLERLLHRSPTDDAELAKASLQDLAKRLDALHQLSH